MRVVPLTRRIVSKVDLLYIRIIMDVYTACHYNVPKKDGDIRVVAKKAFRNRNVFLTTHINQSRMGPYRKPKARGGDMRWK